MSLENVEVIRSSYEATRHDLYAVLDLLADDAEWHAEAGGPLEATYIGPDGARRWLEQMDEAWQAYAIDPEEFIDAGDYVLVPMRVWARARATGIEVEVQIVHAWKLREGKIVWTKSYPTKTDALEAVELRE